MMRQRMNRFLARFRGNERGAVTVDWVVITAAVIALGIVVMSLIETEALGLATTTGGVIAEGVD